MMEVNAAPKRRVTVGLMWHSLGSGNLGVGALTESNISIIRGVAERIGLSVCFVIMGTSETTLPDLAAELATAGHKLEVSRIRVFRRQFRDTLKRCDLVVDIGEGDSFADIYGLKRFLFYWLSKNIVCWLGKPLILAPQTIGPFDGALTRVLARQVMGRCKTVFSRDHLSSEYLSKLGVTGNIEEAIDVAFRLPYIRPERPESGTVRVGINVSGLLFNGGYTGNNQFGLSIDYAQTIRAIISYFCQQPEVEVHLISHVIEPHMPIEDDVRAAEKLAKEFPGVVVAPIFTRPSEAKSYISGMDFFTGARMHACIAAFSSGVAVIPMAYSRKFNGLFGTLGFSNIADCRLSTSQEIESIIIEGFSKRDSLNAKIENSLKFVEIRLSHYDSEIKNVLSSLVSEL